MPLPDPTLDNRRFDQLVGEGRALIPRLSPGWTDHNASDPGITLLELGAWLAEQNIYRLDRLSPEAVRRFVRLVGVEPAPPSVAATVACVSHGQAAGLALPARVQLGDAAGLPRFETIEALHASPALLQHVACGRPGRLADASAANAALAGFEAFGARPRCGHVMALGFDRALDAGGATLSLHLWTPSWRADAATRDALVAEQDRQALEQPPHCTAGPDWRLHYRVRTVWEYHAGAGSWLPLQELVDETRALSLSGFVRFRAPTGHQPGPDGTHFVIRCRIVRGRFECSPRLLHIGFNAVPCEHALSVADQPVGRARGHAGAHFPLGRAPAVAGSVRLRLDDGAGGVQADWQEAPDFDRAGAHDREFVLDPLHAEIVSGDGLRGAVLPAGFDLRAAWRTGGGEAGNLPASTLMTVPATPENVALVPALAALVVPPAAAQPFDAVGGAEAELPSRAQARAFERASAVDKAVTLQDIEALARATPGVPVARVRAVAGLAPGWPCVPAPGVVSLIVIPPCPRPAPMPSRALLDAVQRHLAPRRLVTSEIVAIAPRYRRVGVAATLHLQCEVEPRAVLAAAAARVDAFLDPLDGGPDGRGWPFGRTLYRSELMALLVATTGVRHVTAFAFLTGTAASAGAAAGAGSDCGCAARPAGATNGPGGRCDNVVLCAHELPVPGRHRLQWEADIPPTLTRSDAHDCESA